MPLCGMPPHRGSNLALTRDAIRSAFYAKKTQRASACEGAKMAQRPAIVSSQPNSSASTGREIYTLLSFIINLPAAHQINLLDFLSGKYPISVRLSQTAWDVRSCSRYLIKIQRQSVHLVMTSGNHIFTSRTANI